MDNGTPDDQVSKSFLGGKVLLFIAFLIICFNLRTGFDAPDPLLGTIKKDLGLSLDDSGLFALLPVFVLGVAAPLSSRIAQYMAPWKIILWFQLLAIIGIFWRSADGIVGLFGGMVVMGLGLGIAGAALPGLIKHQFPQSSSMMMGIYSAMIGIGSAVASGTSVPISNWLGSWRYGLSVWGLPILIGMALWWINFARQKKGEALATSPPVAKGQSLLHSSKAWQVTIFYLSRVGAAYFFYTWIPIFLHQRGMSKVDAGYILSISMLAQLPASLTAHYLEQKMGGRGHLIILAMSSAAVSCWGILYMPLDWAVFFAIIFGLATGTVFSRGMALMVERAKTPAESIRLSGMAQGIGFTGATVLCYFCTSFLQVGGSFLPFCLIYSIFCITGLIFGRLSALPGYV